MKTTAALIDDRLTTAFHPQALEIIDESYLHEGHAGSRPGGETHFRVKVISEAFTGKSRIERHRMVYDALGELMKDRIHALVIEAFVSLS